MTSRHDSDAELRVAREALEQFRQSGLLLDRQGRFWHEGKEVSHTGLRRAFLRWIDRLDDGRPILRLDADRYVYLEVEETPLLVTSLRWEGNAAVVRTNDGADEPLDNHSVTVGPDHALYCRVRGGRLEARLTTTAAQALADHIVEDPPGTFALRAAGERFPIGVRQR